MVLHEGQSGFAQDMGVHCGKTGMPQVEGLSGAHTCKYVCVRARLGMHTS